MHIARFLAVNWREIGVNCGFYSRKRIFSSVHLVCVFSSQQTLARIDFLRPIGNLVNKKALIMLKLLRNILQSMRQDHLLNVERNEAKDEKTLHNQLARETFVYKSAVTR